MKFDAKFVATTLVTTCLFTLPGYSQSAITPQGQPAPISTQPVSPQVLPQNAPAERIESPDAPTKLNKCSQLIGTSVKNMQGQRMGKIEDIVVNLDDGRVSYCVVSVDRGLLASSKSVAVPLSAMHPSGDRSYLTMDVDKDKFANAQGFDRDNWPSVTNPTWGAQPWQSSTPSYNAQPNNQNNQYPNTAPASGNYQNSNTNPKSDLSTPRQDGSNPNLDGVRQRDNNGSTTPSDPTH